MTNICIYENNRVKVIDQKRTYKNGRQGAVTTYYKVLNIDTNEILQIPAGEYNRKAKCENCGISAGRCKCSIEN